MDFINSVVSGKISMKMVLNVGRSVFYYVPKLLFSREKGKLLVGLVDAWRIFWVVCLFLLYWYYLCHSLKGRFFFFLPKYMMASSSIALSVRAEISACSD